MLQFIVMAGSKSSKLTLLTIAAAVLLPATALYGREARICRDYQTGIATPNTFLTGDTVQYAYDDSCLYYEVVDSLNCGYAVRFTPLAYPFTITSIGLFITHDGVPTASFTIKFYKGKNGQPDSLWANLPGVSAVSVDSFNWFDVSGLNLTVDSGDFFAGIGYLSNYSPYVGTDSAPPLHHRSWGLHNNVWASFDSIDPWPSDSMDLMIRARGILPTAIEETVVSRAELRILGCEPNPFRTGTEIRFLVPRAGPVNLDIYDHTGARVRTLIAGLENPGIHSAVWDGTDDRHGRLPAGVYFFRLSAGTSATVKKIVLLGKTGISRG